MKVTWNKKSRSSENKQKQQNLLEYIFYFICRTKNYLHIVFLLLLSDTQIDNIFWIQHEPVVKYCILFNYWKFFFILNHVVGWRVFFIF